MSFRSFAIAFTLIWGIALPHAVHAQTTQWAADSSDTIAITGNIELSATKIVFQNHKSLNLAYVRQADDIDLSRYGYPRLGPNQLYRIINPDKVQLLHGSILCGSMPTFIILSEGKEELNLAVFYGADLTRLNFTSRLCGLFAYRRGSAPTEAQVAMKPCLDMDEAETQLQTAITTIKQKHAKDTVFLTKFDAAQEAWRKFADAELEAIYPAENPQAEYGSLHEVCFCSEKTGIIRDRLKQLQSWTKPVPEGELCGSSRDLR